MLVLSVPLNERIVLTVGGEQVRLSIVRTGNVPRIGFDASRDVRIEKESQYLERKRSATAAESES